MSTKFLKLASAGPRLYALTTDGKLWLRSEWHEMWHPVDGPEENGTALIICDVAVRVDDPADPNYIVYALTTDGRLFHDGLRTYPVPWTEVELP